MTFTLCQNDIAVNKRYCGGRSSAIAAQSANGQIVTNDSIANRLMNEARALTTYAYDAANQLQTLVNATGTTTFTFDAGGSQLIEDTPTGRATNGWDYDNQLTGVALPSGARVTMAYNKET